MPPNAHKTLSPEGTAGIKLWEHGSKPALRAYNDGTGTWTIGWGATEGVHEGMKISRAQADAMFDKEIEQFIAAVHRRIAREISQGLFDALVSFFYNVGAASGKTLVHLVNSGNEAKIRGAFMMYVFAYDQKLGKKTRWPGLVNRRQKELAHWAMMDEREARELDAEPVPLPPALPPPITPVLVKSKSAWALVNAQVVLALGIFTDFGSRALDFASGIIGIIPDVTIETLGFAKNGVAMSEAIGFDWGKVSFAVVSLCALVALIRHVRDKRLIS